MEKFHSICGIHFPSHSEEARLFRQHNTPQVVIAHGEAVSQCALELASQLTQTVDIPLLQSACRLHDFARREPEHARAGAKILTQMGYPALADIIAGHHDLPEQASLEACLLYLADKLVQEERRIPLEERFQSARQKCQTPEALARWQDRYSRALKIICQYQLKLEK